MRTTALRILTASFLLSLWSSLAYAQATRTWVSGLGNDSNPCTRTSPCQTFAGALPKTAAGGEISALDPGGFGPVTITKSITLNGEASLATIVATGTNAIVVNAGPTDVVVLRNLQLQGGTTGQIGIQFLAGGALHVENCTISGFNASPAKGIDFSPATGGTSQLLIKDTMVRENGNVSVGGGIYVTPAASTNATASLSNVRSERNVVGLRVQDRSSVFVRDSVFATNFFSGVTALSAAGDPVTIFLDHVSSVGNGTTGIAAGGGPLAVVRITHVSTSGNQTGLLVNSGGQIISFGSNSNGGNGTDGAPTSTVPQQ